jgi:hypothetical protein
MPSLTLPSVADTAITTIKELLCFSTLPYYQVSGVLKNAEGAVIVGDPIAYDGTYFVKYAPANATVTDEAVGTGDSAKKSWDLVHGNIVSITNVKVNAASQTEGTDYWCDYVAGQIKFHTAPGAVAITATYVWAADAEADHGKVVGFVRIPGDSTSAAVPIEVVIGGGVKYSLISTASNYDARIFRTLGARYVIAADAVIF